MIVTPQNGNSKHHLTYRPALMIVRTPTSQTKFILAIAHEDHSPLTPLTFFCHTKHEERMLLFDEQSLRSSNLLEETANVQ
jgi:hypothetical protein